MVEHLELHVLPGVEMTRREFVRNTPYNSIALDGVVKGGPFYDPKTYHINFDHHDGVVREATMSTSKQVWYAIKQGLFDTFRDERGNPFAHLYVNDSDQDTGLAYAELVNYKQIEGTNGSILLNRLVELTDRLDITGGAFPMNLSDQLLRQYAWIFQNYAEMRKSGKLKEAGEAGMRACLEATNARVVEYLAGRGEELTLDIRREILHDDPRYKVIDEIGGNDARFHLFSRGLQAFISKVATRSDGRMVYAVGRRSRFVSFPVTKLYEDFNNAEGLPKGEGWGGSDIVGGSSRLHGSKLSVDDLVKITDARLKKEGK